MSQAHGPSPIATLRSACLGVFCDSAAPEGPFTTFTTLLAPFQSWCFFSLFFFLPPLALRCYLHRKTMIQRDGERHANKYIFFSPLLRRLRPRRQPGIYAEKKSLFFLDTRLEFFLVCVFSLVLPRTFSHSCAAASIALYAWHAQGSFSYVYPHSHMLNEQHCLRLCL